MTIIIKTGTTFISDFTYKTYLRTGIRCQVKPVKNVLLLAGAEVVG